MYHAVKESEGSHSEEAHMEGDYEVCFDNRMSTWAEKVLWFEVTVHDPIDDYYDDYIGKMTLGTCKDDYYNASDSEEWNDIRERNEDTESLYEMATGDLKAYMQSVRLKLGKVKHYQFMQGADMSRVSGILFTIMRIILL